MIQETLFNACQPMPTTTHRHGYVSHCGCGWQSAVEYLKRHATECLYRHINDQKLSAAHPKAPDLPSR